MEKEQQIRTFTRKYKKGDIIFNEGDTGNELFFINTGRVKVFKKIYRNNTFQEYELTRLGPRAIFGEMALLGQMQRTASVKALYPTECTVISRNVFDSHFNKLPAWMQTVIKNLVIRLDDTNKRLKQTIEK
ncbi:MAG: cyclic nucleotide-binding domain-containing protein [Fibrobacterota bacterium]